MDLFRSATASLCSPDVLPIVYQTVRKGRLLLTGIECMIHLSTCHAVITILYWPLRSRERLPTDAS